MVFDDIPRINCFSLGDFRNFEKCYFDFLVRHHLQKRYELEEGNSNQTIGTLLDLVIKIIHRSKAYSQSLDYILTSIFKAAEAEIRDKVEHAGPKSFYGGTIKFLTEENIQKAKKVFQNYYEKKKGKMNKFSASPINQAILKERFWDCVLEGEEVFKIWGGPDALELGEDGMPEIVDYKYFEDPQKGRENLDMDMMPKLYTLLCAAELLKAGYKKARFRVISWTDPEDDSLYEEFDLETAGLLKDFFKHKIEKILSITEITFCDKPYCKTCKSELKEEWLKELKTKGFILS